MIFKLWLAFMAGALFSLILGLGYSQPSPVALAAVTPRPTSKPVPPKLVHDWVGFCRSQGLTLLTRYTTYSGDRVTACINARYEIAIEEIR